MMSKVAISNIIFGLVASALTVYDPKATGFVILVLMVLSMSLPAFYLSYRRGYLRGKMELLEKMNEVIEAINEANKVTLGVDAAFGDIKPLEILQKERREK